MVKSVTVGAVKKVEWGGSGYGKSLKGRMRDQFEKSRRRWWKFSAVREDTAVSSERATVNLAILDGCLLAEYAIPLHSV